MSQEYRHILRIMGTDVEGTLKTIYALTKIKGVSLSLANAVLKKAGINPASVTKLLDRGSTQAVGVVSDIGTFLPLLAEEIEKLNK